jgi:hypothetical protein
MFSLTSEAISPPSEVSSLSVKIRINEFDAGSGYRLNFLDSLGSTIVGVNGRSRFSDDPDQRPLIAETSITFIGNSPLEIDKWYTFILSQNGNDIDYSVVKDEDSSIFASGSILGINLSPIEKYIFLIDDTPPGNSSSNSFDEVSFFSISEIGDADGIIEVRVNGITVISESGIVNRESIQKTYGGIALHAGSGVAHGVTTDIDDFYVWDDSGSWNNSFLGDKRALLKAPDADTNVSDFDPISGDLGYLMLNEDSPDDDTAYVFADSAILPGSPPLGSSEFELQNIQSGASHIAGISVFTRAKKTDSSDVEIFTSVISHVNAVSGSPHNLGETYEYHMDLYEYDPFTIANFTRDGFNLALFSINAQFSAGTGSPAESPGGSPAEQTYSEFIISLSSTAYWRLGESSGTTAADEIGSNDGAYTNGPLLGQTGLITGDPDTCIRLDGTNDFVTMGDVLNPGTSDFSVVIWINADTLTTNRLIQKRGTGGGGATGGWQISTSAGNWNNIFVDAGDGSYSQINTSSAHGVTTGSIFMVSITWKNSTGVLKLYINDTHVATGSNTGTPAGKSITTTRPMTIGCADNGGGTRSQFFDGFEDEAAIWIGTELTAQNISDIYDKGTGA